MEKDRINYLYRQHLENKLTSEELAEWDALLAEPSDALHELTEELWGDQDETPAMERGEAMETYQYIVAQPQSQQPVRRLWQRFAAAASILIACSVGGYFVLHQQKTNQTAQLIKNDIAPGHSQATLTLANGKKIVLTKGLTGQLAIQNSTVINASPNAITYSAKNQTGDQVSLNTLATARGEQSPYPLVLADGTKVWLNAQSSITFPTAFKGKERIVKLTGEAYFEVRHNSQHPFKVQTEKQTIEDIGTSFNVNAYTDETSTKTTLIEGSVKVNNLIIKPGEQTDGKTVFAVDAGQFTAWKDGDFNFDGDKITTVMRQLKRWYNIDVRYQGNPTNEGFHAVISRKKNISAILRVLERTKGVRFKIEGKEVTVIQ